MAWAINLSVGENIYGRFGRVIGNNQDATNDVFPTIRIFSLVICKRHFVQLTSCQSHIKIHLSSEIQKAVSSEMDEKWTRPKTL
jgi:hypothetical protein